MTLLERIQNANDDDRVEFPLANGLDSFRVGELKDIVNAQLERLVYRCKALVEGMDARDQRRPDAADFRAAFQHELWGVDNKLGRRKQAR